MAVFQNGQALANTLKYRKTEHDYDVEVEVTFNADGTAKFTERDAFDLRSYPFTPCPVERAFAESLRARPQSTNLSHLKLDQAVVEEMATKWLAEPDSVAKGIAMIDDALRQLSLSRLNGEHLMRGFADALRRGRELADEKDVAEKATARVKSEEAVVEKRIEHWLRSVERLVAASGRNGQPPRIEPGESAA